MIALRDAEHGSRRLTSEAVRTATLMSSVMTMGLAAGVFALYAHTIMPGLRTTDDRTFVGAFQAIDRAIVNALNDAIKAAGDPDRINVAAVRESFHYGRWVAWNLVRVLTTVPAFGLLAWALVLHGRATA